MTHPRSHRAPEIFNGMVLVLIIALAVSLGIQSWIESGVIGFVVLANVFVGFIQYVAAVHVCVCVCPDRLTSTENASQGVLVRQDDGLAPLSRLAFGRRHSWRRDKDDPRSRGHDR